jgi:hypothetical protein
MVLANQNVPKAGKAANELITITNYCLRSKIEGNPEKFFNKKRFLDMPNPIHICPKKLS